MLSKKIFLILIFIFSQNSFGSLDLALVGGLSLANQIVTNPPGVVSNSEKYLAVGPWVNLVFPQSEFGFSTGLQYVQTGANLTQNFGTATTVTDSKSYYLQIPLTFNFWPTDWTSLGFGIYGGIPLSNVNWDYGLTLNGQIKIPVGVVTFLMVNVIYEYGLSNLDNSGNTIRSSNLLLQGGAGLNF